jgi:hypothetical protein
MLFVVLAVLQVATMPTTNGPGLGSDLRVSRLGQTEYFVQRFEFRSDDFFILRYEAHPDRYPIQRFGCIRTEDLSSGYTCSPRRACS